jgi:hypothetical protein
LPTGKPKKVSPGVLDLSNGLVAEQIQVQMVAGPAGKVYDLNTDPPPETIAELSDWSSSWLNRKAEGVPPMGDLDAAIGKALGIPASEAAAFPFAAKWKLCSFLLFPYNMTGVAMQFARMRSGLPSPSEAPSA